MQHRHHIDVTTTLPPPQPAAPGECDCPRPIPEERAEHKGASRTYCARCDRPISLRRADPRLAWR